MPVSVPSFTYQRTLPPQTTTGVLSQHLQGPGTTISPANGQLPSTVTRVPMQQQQIPVTGTLPGNNLLPHMLQQGQQAQQSHFPGTRTLSHHSQAPVPYVLPQNSPFTSSGNTLSQSGSMLQQVQPQFIGTNTLPQPPQFSGPYTVPQQTLVPVVSAAYDNQQMYSYGIADSSEIPVHQASYQPQMTPSVTTQEQPYTSGGISNLPVLPGQPGTSGAMSDFPVLPTTHPDLLQTQMFPAHDTVGSHPGPTGISQMGLFWSMRSSPSMPQGLRLVKNNASSPLVTDLTAFNGHLTFEQTYISNVKPMLQKKIRRWYMARGVQKIPVRNDRLRGTLFLPPGKGPFPAVIDMYGIVGSCVEFRAALLASRGFAALALPYFLFDDLPKDLSELQFEYFMEAVDWLAVHPYVDGNNLGAIGVSKGGEIALQMGYYSNKIKSVVSINGAPYLSIKPMMYKGVYIGVSDYDPAGVIKTEEGLDARNTVNCDIENYLPIWERNVRVLLICGQDDMQLRKEILPNLLKCYPESRKYLCELHVYPGAGHLIDTPYAPLARSTIKRRKGVLEDFGHHRLLWGGETVAHANAQEDSWKHILKHFRTTLFSTAPAEIENAKSSKL